MRLRDLLLSVVILALAGAANAAVVVSTSAKPSPVERLAALEVQRYVYLRTGKLPETGTRTTAERIVIVKKGSAGIAPAIASDAKSLGGQQYIIKTIRSGGKTTWWIVGGDEVGTLYGAYKFVEDLGVRFYLHGDVVPDKKLAKLPLVNEIGKPIFSIRGIQPFHDFTEGPDWWNTDDYLAYISQLAKMRMNFIGLHCYPGGMAEPSVWIGMPSEVDKQGQVTASYPSRWANTALDGFWGYKATPTSEYCAGASLIFASDRYGDDMMDAMFPAPTTAEACNTVFNNVGMSFARAFALAKSIGVKTCVGTETPLTVPAAVADRLKQQGKDPKDPAVTRELYKGMFTRIARAYPVDYYWLWTPEGWTWSGNNDDQLKATTDDIKAALGALDSIGNPFTLATCGWVLGPVNDRAALDSILPKTCPMSCINRSVGHAPVEEAFAKIQGRPKWAIPWMENDPVLTAPQPWVGRMRYDAADAKRLGCTGLLGIHWRTKAMAQNVSALAAAGWDQSYTPRNFASSRTSLDKRTGPLGGQVVTYGDPVEGTDDDAVYQSVRYNMDGYRLTVPNGTYTVTLKFNEPCYNDTGKRVFGVKLQGKTVIDRLDMIEKAGKDVALDYVYPDTAVTDSVVAIDFIKIVEFPCMAGIVIEGQTSGGRHYTRKINCGGERYKDYEADRSDFGDKSDQRGLPCEDFYIDFARASFGDAVAVEAGKIMASVDGRGMPEPVGWIGGPGCVVVNREPWEKVKERYAFVDRFEAILDKVKSPGDRERFSYWLNTYRYARTLGELGCVRGQLDMRVEAMAAAPNGSEGKARLIAQTLELRRRLTDLWEQAIGYQLMATDTPGEMGTIDNLERHSRMQMQFLTLHDNAISKAMGSPLPEDLALDKAYNWRSRIVVPTVRTQVKPGESLRLKVIILDYEATSASLYWRPMGHGAYKEIKLSDIGRSVNEVRLPAAKGSFEYYIAANTSAGLITWPATAPKINQTVVVW